MVTCPKHTTGGGPCYCGRAPDPEYRQGELALPRPFNRPSKQELLDTIEKCKTREETAFWYGVSPQTISYWLKKYGDPVKWKIGRPRK